MRKALFILFLLLILPTFAIVEENGKTIYYLDDCIKYALENSPIVQKAKVNYEIAKSEQRITRANYFPTIGAGVHYFQYVNSNKRYDDGYSKRLLPDVGVYLDQLLFDFGKTSSLIDMRKFKKIAAEYDYKRVANETVNDVKMAYFDVLEARSTVDIEENNLYLNERIVNTTKKLFEENKKSKTDYIDAQVHLIEAKMGVIEAKNLYNIAMADLRNKMYYDDKADFEIKSINEFFYVDAYFTPAFIKKSAGQYIYKKPDDMKPGIDVNYEARILKLPFTLEEAYQSAYNNNPQLKVLENTLSAVKKQTLFIKREYFPTLKAKVGYNRDNKYISQVPKIHNNQLNIAVTLDSSVNILQKKNEIDKMNLLIQSAQKDIDAYRKDIYYDIKKYYMDIETAQLQIENSKDKILKAMESLEATRNAYLNEDNTKIGYIELQNARQTYNMAKLDYISRLRFYNDSLANLQKLIEIYKIEDIL